MESKYALLANTILHEANKASNNKSKSNARFLVAIAGIPGSGKTTTAEAVVRYINNNRSNKKATLLSMDGFHLPRATLDKLPNREEAYIRRGAPWTFDIERFLGFMKRLRVWADSTPSTPSSSSSPQSSISTSTASSTSSSQEQQKEEEEKEVIYAPTFNHSTKDPLENALKITPDISIIIIEGNYLLLDEPGWRDIADLVDYKVFVDTDLQEARARVAKRHVRAGIEKTLEDGFRRVDGNDYLNGVLVRERLIRPDLVIRGEE